MNFAVWLLILHECQMTMWGSLFRNQEVQGGEQSLKLCGALLGVRPWVTAWLTRPYRSALKFRPQREIQGMSHPSISQNKISPPFTLLECTVVKLL